MKTLKFRVALAFNNKGEIIKCALMRKLTASPLIAYDLKPLSEIKLDAYDHRALHYAWQRYWPEEVEITDEVVEFEVKDRIYELLRNENGVL